MGLNYIQPLHSNLIQNDENCSPSVGQQQPKDLLCDLCVDVVTDIDEFLVSQPTEQQLIEFVEQLCKAIGAILPDLVATCNALVEAQLPSIIEGIVNVNLNPNEVCKSIGMC